MPRTQIPLAGGNRKMPEHNFYDFRNLRPTTGNIYFVDSGASASGSGLSPEDPKTTIDAAINLCTANNGDIIYVMEGHAETITAAGGIDADVAGISIIGLGVGTNRPQITLGTATTADIDIDAVNILFRNMDFICNIDSLATFFDVNFGNFTLEDCRFYTSSTKEALCFIDLATEKDDFYIRRCEFYQPTDPAGTDGGAGTGAIYCVDSENIFIEGCCFYGNFETAMVHNRTTACKNLWIKNCVGYQALSGAEPLQLVDGATGATVGGAFLTPAETATTEATLVGTVGNSFFLCGTYFGNDGAAGGQGGILATAAS